MGGGTAGARRACFTCHGLSGQGNGALSPALAGLPRGYLQKQLEDYGSGRRPDPVMAPVAKALQTSDRAAVAAYYASLPPATRPASASDASAGAGLYHTPRGGVVACAECHGAEGQGAGFGNPPIAGQPAAYVGEQLRRWRSGQRRNDPAGVMAAAARGLSDDQVRALALYVAALPPRSARGDAPPAASP